MVHVHARVSLDYEHNCSYIHDQAGVPFVACLTEKAEGLICEAEGIRDCDTSDEAFCEWAYFWKDRLSQQSKRLFPT